GADRRGIGVRVVHRHPVVWHAERVGDDLRVNRLRSLADVDRSGEHVDSAVWLELDPGLGGIAVLVHPGWVLDCREPSSLVHGHREAPPPSSSTLAPSRACCAARCSGSRFPLRRSLVICMYSDPSCSPTRCAAARVTGTVEGSFIATRLAVVSPIRFAFLRRSSHGFIPSTSAIRFMCNSTAIDTEVTPKPRIAVVGTRFVNTTNPSNLRFGIV